jgi:Toluene-4-monooxygenase system protein B (TmoB)
VIPLYGFLEGDTLGLLVLASPEDTMEALADKLQCAAAVRVARRPHVSVVYGGKPARAGATVATLGMKPLERFDVVAGDREGS